jgi:GntR family transcriptional regulator, transcriptional repressor for pyruvate dehydrogenase complex
MSLFQPLRSANASLDGRIVAYVRDLVERGELTPGDRLPPERELAAQLGVSRTVLREALHTLAALGFVELRHGRGVFVTGGSAQATAQRLSASLGAPGSAARVHELFEIRRVLEGAAAAWAAERASPEQVAELRDVVAQAGAVAGADEPDTALAGELDARLHALIAASAANHTLTLLMGSLLDELGVARGRSLTIPGRIARSVEQHERLVAAIAARDPAAARARMLEHLDDVERAILETTPLPAPPGLRT